MRLPYVTTLEKRAARRGAAAVELALLLPVLVFCSRCRSTSRVVTCRSRCKNCARNGALYELDAEMNTVDKAGILMPYSSVSSAVQADAPAYMANDPSFSVAATSPALKANNYVTVTVTYAFRPIALLSMGRYAVNWQPDHTEPVGHNAVSLPHRMPFREIDRRPMAEKATTP